MPRKYEGRKRMTIRVKSPVANTIRCIAIHDKKTLGDVVGERFPEARKK
jgi:hypothetical protein